MRTAFINTLTELAEKDESIYLLTGDLGFSVFEDFAKRFPKRFVNCGVAEQNMMGVAAGLALSGKKVYVYSIVPFVTLRCLEQIKNDVCYQNLDVKIIGMGGGLTYGSLGATHHAIEDIAVLRALPNMTVLCPADPAETEELLLKSYQTKNPTYIRLAKSKEKSLYNTKPKLEIGKPSVLKEGRDGALISTGIQVVLCMEVVEKLKEAGLNFKLISLHTLKPINRESLLKEIIEIKKIFVLEEHSIIGGLGSIVAEILAESDWQGDFRITAIPDEYSAETGSAEYFRNKYQLGREETVGRILSEYNNIR